MATKKNIIFDLLHLLFAFFWIRTVKWFYFSDPRGICLIWIRAVFIYAEFYHRYRTVFFYEEEITDCFGSGARIFEFRIHESFFLYRYRNKLLFYKFSMRSRRRATRTTPWSKTTTGGTWRRRWWTWTTTPPWRRILLRRRGPPPPLHLVGDIFLARW